MDRQILNDAIAIVVTFYALFFMTVLVFGPIFDNGPAMPHRAAKFQDRVAHR
jgi:hypothetical protein